MIEVNWKGWDGDVSKLSPAAVRGLLAVLRAEAAKQSAEEAASEAARQPVGILPAAVKEKIVKTDHSRVREQPG